MVLQEENSGMGNGGQPQALSFPMLSGIMQKHTLNFNSIKNGKAAGDGILKYWLGGQLIINRTNVSI